MGARLARVASSADSQPEAGPASRELHGWTLEALISGGPAVAHIAHAILRQPAVLLMDEAFRKKNPRRNMTIKVSSTLQGACLSQTCINGRLAEGSKTLSFMRVVFAL